MFFKRFEYNPESPTCFYYKGTTKPAGYKDRKRNSYQWLIDTQFMVKSKRTTFTWSLPKVIFEVSRGIELNDSYMMVYHLDGDKDNNHPDNLALRSLSTKPKREENVKAYHEFKNVLISKENSDYFKHPSQWSNPESLEALAREKQLRIDGISQPPKLVGGQKR